MAHQEDRARPPQDPVYVHARREAVVVVVAWLACLAWTLGVCGAWGYAEPSPRVETTLGMPSWVFWGVLAPWVAATLFTLWFALFYMAEDDLGPSHAPPSEETRDAGER